MEIRQYGSSRGCAAAPEAAVDVREFDQLIAVRVRAELVTG
ncbi:MAG: hypothetical protein AVDCRST_MAG75-2297 [uncultured Propionibacteriaceae bacterium]|uniref:Uncharacterized protein n=1 Tax=uncultured Propionibacteriaceae bacterium TaxID=257457 RepID=A0A6J4P1D9_9ACTN|nr:MAG: hypothetical protein AVDCRST_MAG75-2297 [uncultured Propionibacteriaceae bacterium]